MNAKVGSIITFRLSPQNELPIASDVVLNGFDQEIGDAFENIADDGANGSGFLKGKGPSLKGKGEKGKWDGKGQKGKGKDKGKGKGKEKGTQKGKDKGQEKGREKGKEKGQEKGKEKGKEKEISQLSKRPPGKGGAQPPWRAG